MQALINWCRLAFEEGPVENVDGVSTMIPDALPVAH